MIKSKKIVLIWVLSLCLIGLAQSNALAQIRLRITEPKVRLSIVPGGSASGQIAIENPTEQELKVRCYLEDWFYTTGGDGAKEFRAASTTPLSCASWVTFSPAEFLLQPFARRLMNYRVEVPKTAIGGYYAVLFFETVIGEGQDEQGLNVLILGRLGSLFYIEAEGTVVKEASLEDIKVNRAAGGLKVTATFKNIGNVDITASGSFYLINEKGEVFARGQFNEVYTFPEDKAFLLAVYERPVELGSYDLVVTLDLAGRTFVEEHRVRVD